MGFFTYGRARRRFFLYLKGILRCLFLWWVSAASGIGELSPRLLTPRGYKTLKWGDYFSHGARRSRSEGGPDFWVAKPSHSSPISAEHGDPSCPRYGQMVSHRGWI